MRLFGIALSLFICFVLVGCGDKATPVPTPHGESSAVSFTTPDGLALKGRLFGKGQTGVVLAHMYAADQSSWWEFAQVLADGGHMALAFDFRGYGDSGGDKDIELIDLDVEAALEFLGGQGPSTFFLVGASMGAAAALKLAARRSAAGVVSLSAPLEFKGLSLKGEKILVPVLLMATKGDKSATNNIEVIVDNGIVGGPEVTEQIVYVEGNDHGTDILTGTNGDAAQKRILDFIEKHRP